MKNRIFRYEIWIVALLILMPIILILFDGGNVRPSISNYVYMEHNQVFYFLLFLAASMFGNNGAIWLKNYNIFIGIFLAGIALTPHEQFTIIHFIFAGLFFASSVFVMIYYSSKKQRIHKIYAGIFILLAMFGHFALNLYSLFYAEWISILPICIHFIGESKNVVD